LQRAHEVTHNEVQRAHEEAESAPAFPPPAASERGIRGEYCLSSVACILAIVQKYPVVIFVKKGCPYCATALEALRAEGMTVPVVIDLTGPSGPPVQALLNSFTGRRTVPNVFVGGKSIGGGDETRLLHHSGELGNLLRAANAL